MLCNITSVFSSVADHSVRGSEKKPENTGQCGFGFNSILLPDESLRIQGDETQGKDLKDRGGLHVRLQMHSTWEEPRVIGQRRPHYFRTVKWHYRWPLSIVLTW